MKTIFIESDLSSFEDFHDHEWLKQTFELVKGTSFERITEDFAAQWWGSARAFVLPWLFITGIHDVIYLNASIQPDKSPQEVWNEYLTNDGFKGALWKLAESMYCSIYYAYENLIVNVLKEIKNIELRVTDRDFNKVLIEVYGDELANTIWNNNKLSLSREIRNCIVHNGGKASNRLSKMRPLPHIKDGNVLISASDSRMLYNSLKPHVYKILKRGKEKLGGGNLAD